MSWAGGAKYALSSGNDGAVVLWDADAPNDEGEGASTTVRGARRRACWSVHSPTASDSLRRARLLRRAAPTGPVACSLRIGRGRADFRGALV